jgi:hypothetical protein
MMQRQLLGNQQAKADSVLPFTSTIYWFPHHGKGTSLSFPTASWLSCVQTRSLIFMHVVRYGAPIRTAVSTVPRRRLSAVATNVAKSVVADRNAKKRPSAAGRTSGFKPFKESVGLQSGSNKSATPPLGNLTKKRVKKKIKYYSDLLAESGDSITRHKDATDSLMGTLRAMGRPVPLEKLPPKESWKGESVADDILQMLVPVTSPDKLTSEDSESRGITRKTSKSGSEHNGWKGEDWGPDG